MSALVVSIVVGGSKIVFASKIGTRPVLCCGNAEMMELSGLSLSAVKASAAR